MNDLIVEQLQKEVMLLRSKMEYFEKLVDFNLLNLSIDSGNLPNHNKGKCHSNYNKSDLAQLFYVLMDEKILFFDKQKDNNNRGMMQQFVIDSFTYIGEGGIQKPIRTISKQFSEAKGFTYKAKHLIFLDKILEVFKERRERISRM